MRLWRALRRRYWDDERARELESYLAEETAENVARGMAPAEARAAAHRKLGNATRIREEIYEMNSLGLLEALWHDLRYAARVLRRNPVFACVTILSLALGIGANTALFQLLDALQFRMLPVRAPQELVELRPQTQGRWGATTGRRSLATYAIWDELRRSQRSFSGLLAWGTYRFDLSSSGESRFVPGLWVSGSFFDVLGVAPAAGRLFAESDDVRGCGTPGVVLGDAFWRRQYGGAASAIGSTLRLSGHPFEILGVAPASFAGLEVGRSFDVALPLCAEPIIEPEANAVARRHYWWLDVVGRLKPGVTLARANAELASISPALAQATVSPQLPPEAAKKFLAMKLTGEPAGTGMSSLRGTYQEPLWMLLAVAGTVLLIACANLASLMLARATAREREMAVRLAIGASRGRLFRQLMAESLLLAAAGAAGGVLVAQALGSALVRFMSTDGNRLFFDLGLDARVLAFASAIAAVAAIVFGVAPALRATRHSAAAAVRTVRGMTDSRERFALRRVLVGVQVMLSLVLVVFSLLFVRTAMNLATVDPGFRTEGILVADFDPHAAAVPPARQAQFERELRERIAAVPGVSFVADAAIEPLTGSIWNDRIIVDGVAQQTISNENHVSPGFFKLFDIPIVAGRDFSEADLPGTPPVAIVNEAFARTLLNTATPIGRTFKLETSPGEPDLTYQVVGLVPTTKYGDVRDKPGPIAYFPEAQLPTPDMVLSEAQVFVRGSGSLSSLAPAITAAAQGLSPSMLVRYRVMRADAEQSFLRERLMATLSAFFGALAALLATIGLYGVMSYVVARRRSEIGIRLALGAEPAGVVRMILGEAGAVLLAGLAAGTLLAIYAARVTSTLLFGVAPSDPATLAAAVAALAVVGLAASWLPARRASRIEPASALRAD
jgi:predicted permease